MGSYQVSYQAVSDKPFERIHIEPRLAGAPLQSLLPEKLDPAHFHMEFENEPIPDRSGHAAGSRGRHCGGGPQQSAPGEMVAQDRRASGRLIGNKGFELIRVKLKQSCQRPAGEVVR